MERSRLLTNILSCIIAYCFSLFSRRSQVAQKDALKHILVRNFHSSQFYQLWEASILCHSVCGGDQNRILKPVSSETTPAASSTNRTERWKRIPSSATNVGRNSLGKRRWQYITDGTLVRDHTSVKHVVNHSCWNPLCLDITGNMVDVDTMLITRKNEETRSMPKYALKTVWMYRSGREFTSAMVAANHSKRKSFWLFIAELTLVKKSVSVKSVGKHLRKERA